MTEMQQDSRPAATERVSYARDIRPLFRAMDIAEMTFLLDLTSVEDVREFGTAILERVANGSMPCDGPWEPDRVELFRRWIDEGMAD